MIVDADMDELPTDPAAVALTGTVARDAVADSIESAELFDVNVDHLACRPALEDNSICEYFAQCRFQDVLYLDTLVFCLL
jgi:hypothetical protein